MISWSPPPSRVYLYGTFAVARLRILASRVETRGRALQRCVHRQHGVPALVTAIDTERYGVAVIAISPLGRVSYMAVGCEAMLLWGRGLHGIGFSMTLSGS